MSNIKLNQILKLIYYELTLICYFLYLLKIEMERGKVVNSIQLYMIEHGVSEEEAQDHIKSLISYSWEKLNIRNSYPLGFVNEHGTMYTPPHAQVW